MRRWSISKNAFLGAFKVLLWPTTSQVVLDPKDPGNTPNSFLSKKTRKRCFDKLVFRIHTCSWTSPENTGSTISLRTWGSSILVSMTIFWPLGPLAWTLYCQKLRSVFFPPPPAPPLDEPAEVESLASEGLVPSVSLSSVGIIHNIALWDCIMQSTGRFRRLGHMVGEGDTCQLSVSFTYHSSGPIYEIQFHKNKILLKTCPQCLQNNARILYGKPVWPKAYHLRSLCRRCSRLPRLPRRRWQYPEGRRKTDSGPEKGQILSSTGVRQLSDQDKVLILMPINTISMEFLEYFCEAIYFTGNINST